MIILLILRLFKLNKHVLAMFFFKSIPTLWVYEQFVKFVAL